MKSTAMLLAAAAAAVGVVATQDAAAASHRESGRRATQSRPLQPPAPHGSTVVLYDQIANATTSGALVAQYSSSSGAPYDSEGADDFVVPAAGWRITTVQFGAFAGQNTTGAYPTAANVRIYTNDGPAPSSNTACNYSAATVAYDTTTQIATVALPGVCELAAGTYWISYQPMYDFGASGGDYFWNLAAPQVGAIGQWRNPGDGFASGCTAWSATTSCDFTQPDFAFRLSGVVLPVSLQSFSID
ncbi:hypothetical protein DFR29_101125 [Tahibacter aquaticus]|uniref:Secreted protein n=1 Tax=Tahibacter aquaticus TaxID=520092 RepID=A0A4R6Z9H0_9GAMM|nr:hypothetical protein [Tahibacter aquaticus]TDR48505.1 hypothetical protein DFR29_101125 [Tahibacter aquaticus]